jgi:hypothetical protein
VKKPFETTVAYALLKRIAEAEDRADYDEAEIVNGTRCIWVGCDQFGYLALKMLICAGAVSLSSEPEDLRRWHINGVGRMLIKHPEQYDKAVEVSMGIHGPQLISEDGFKPLT